MLVPENILQSPLDFCKDYNHTINILSIYVINSANNSLQITNTITKENWVIIGYLIIDLDFYITAWLMEAWKMKEDGKYEGKIISY